MGDPLSDFCKSPFWDEKVVWNTTNPDLTECFQKTVLIWIPCAFLWLFTPIELYRLPTLTSSSSRHPWTGLTVAKVVFVLFLLTTSILDVTHWLLKYVEDIEDIPYPNFNSPFIKAATYLLILMLLFIQKKRGKSSSGFLFIFWLLSSLASTVTYRTQLTNALDSRTRENLVDFVLCMISYPITVSLLILSSFADVKESTKAANNKQPSPEIDSSFVSQIYFAWFDSLAIKGFRESLAIGDLWDLRPENQSVNVVSNFNRHWRAIRDNFQTGKSKQQPSILTALWRTFRWPFIFAGVMRFIADMLSVVSPLILQLLIDYVSSPSEPTWRGYFYAALLCFSSLIQSVLYGQHYWIMFNISMRVRSAVISAIYEKSLRINATVKRTSTVGEVVNLMSVDAQRLMDLLPELHVMWSAIIQIGVAFYFLWNLLGPSVLAGLGVMLLMIPLNGLIAGKFKLLQIKQMRAKDERVKLMNEVLNGIKVLKLYAWEESFSNQINSLRGHELSVMKSGAYLNALASFVFNSVPLMVTLATFATFVLTDERNILDAPKAFVSLALFNIIRLPLFFIPMMFIAAIQAAVSFKRMNNYLNSGELDSKTVTHDQTTEHAIIVKNATLAWASNGEPILHDITLSIPEKNLVAVVGPVGCGKSSLLSGLLGEMEKFRGYINTKGSIAYVPQQAWIQNATLRDNILFGKPFNQRRYQEVIDACALGPDLAILPGGDQTEIGEKGINLSGGQKQRISLARAVYFDSEVVFLDDPLSAVDSHVGKHIFDNVIGPKGLLKNKTRILVTNGITYLPQTDLIFVFDQGRIKEEGTYHSLVDKKGHFADLIMTYLQQQDDEDLSEEAITDLEDLAQDFLSRLGTPELERQLSRRLSMRSAQGTPLSEASSSDIESSKKQLPPRLFLKTRKTSVASSKKVSQVSTVAKLIQVEAVETGKVSILVYKQYLTSLGLWVAFLAIFAYAASAGFAVGSNFWLSIWSEDATNLVNHTQNTQLRDLRLGVYGGLGLAQSVVVLIASYALALGCINASRFFHNNMLHNVVHCPMSFFDTTPLGRILNRFSKDIDIVDTTIPMILRPLIGTFLQVASTLVVISISTPFFMFVVIPIGLGYYFLQRFYIASSRQLKRLESITRSPIFSHFSETISGASTVRAYGQVEKFIYLSQSKVDTNHVCYYPSIIANRWLAVRLELLSNVISVSAALLAVIGRDTLDPGTVGLSLSYAVAVTQSLIFMVRMTSDLETNIVAVERIKEYTQTETEAPWIEPYYSPPADWPDKGNINFEDYSTRYRKELDLVLRNLDLSIRGGEKIGIVGRTGAGKSSLTLGLFRIIEPSSGLITIDDVHTGKLGLHQLRSKLTIIPQDPVLFSGTLQMNLDPFGKHTDAELWTALEHAHLKNFVQALQDGLSHHIAEGGENLSVGQRQLVCLARALLRKTKVLILDEATAAVDLETDDLIQTTIRREFADCTIITIAHRLNTIMDSNRVVVFDQGTIKEFDDPNVLLQDKKSLFYSMAHDAGIV